MRTAAKPRRVRLGGKCWTLIFRPRLDDEARGICDSPDAPSREIVIDSKLRGVERLEIVIHEFIHAVAWWLDEEFVTRWAVDIARELWALGVRWKDEDK